MVCTPHFYRYNTVLVTRAGEVIREVRKAAAGEGIELRLLLGFEVDLDVVARADTETLRMLTIEGSDGALLLEMPYEGWPPRLEQTLFRLSTAGFLPVLAHPERNDRIQHAPDLLGNCLRAGAVAQATAGSLTGGFRSSSLRTFKALLERGYLSLLASDAHAGLPYTWTPGRMVAEVGKDVPSEALEALVEHNPAILLGGGKPEPVVPMGRRPGRRFGRPERS